MAKKKNWKWMPIDDAGLAVMLLVMGTLLGLGHYVSHGFYGLAVMVTLLFAVIYFEACSDYQKRQ